MRHFNPTFHFIAPEELKMPEEYKLYCKTHQIKYVEHTDFSEEIIADADILYMTRVQRERFTDLMEYERVKNVYILRNKMLENTRPNLRICLLYTSKYLIQLTLITFPQFKGNKSTDRSR